MKNIQYILLMLFISGLAYAQNKSINYKALIKDDSNNVLSNQNITIEFSILEGPEIAFSDVIYAESHTVSTDDNGIVIVNIGEGIPLSGFEDVYNQLDWRSMSYFGSRFLKVQIDSGSGLTDMGTTEFKSVPFALFAEQSNNTGLELINEGSGNGWRLIGRPEDFYGPIAVGAVDLSYSWGPSPTNGATGNYATAVGLNTTASGQSSFASGVGTIASQAQATAMGAGTVASGHSSTAMGIGTRAEAPNSTAIGLYNIGGGDSLLASSTDPLFEIGNGNYVDGTNDNRSNALTVLRNGTITAPSFDLAEITDDKALITKEYLDVNGSIATGLEAIDEGNGTGWRLIGKDPNNYDNIGENAVDLSTNPDAALNLGATGTSTFTAGYKTKASNLASTALGNLTTASGFSSTALGFETIADDQFSTVVGRLNDNTTSTNILFQVGNGSSGGGRSNALSVNFDGVVTAPSFDISEIIDPKALITKEYADVNFGGGLEKIDEGNGIGWRLKGSNPDNYGDIGSNAVDLSISTTASSSFGALGTGAFATGSGTTASGLYSTSLGFSTKALGGYATAIGSQSQAIGAVSTALGFSSLASGNWSTAMGYNTEASGNYAFALGKDNSATMEGSMALGTNTTANANFATAMGANTTASGIVSTAMGNLTTASGLYSTAMGTNTSASGDFSTAFGVGTTAHGQYTFAAGYFTIANGSYSSAFGANTNAYGDYSSTFGNTTRANGENSVAMGLGTLADYTNSLVIGEYNDSDLTNTNILFQIGNGTGDGTDGTFRANALTVYRNGHLLAYGYDLASDRRLKTNISSIKYGLNIILKLNPVAYNWKRYPEESGKTFGLIAQDVQPIINEVVTIGNDNDKTLSVSYIELIPILIKAIQEQQDIINKQDAKINGLTAELEQLKTLDQRVKQLEALTNGQQ